MNTRHWFNRWCFNWIEAKRERRWPLQWPLSMEPCLEHSLMNDPGVRGWSGQPCLTPGHIRPWGHLASFEIMCQKTTRICPPPPPHPPTVLIRLKKRWKSRRDNKISSVFTHKAILQKMPFWASLADHFHNKRYITCLLLSNEETLAPRLGYQINNHFMSLNRRGKTTKPEHDFRWCLFSANKWFLSQPCDLTVDEEADWRVETPAVLREVSPSQHLISRPQC